MRFSCFILLALSLAGCNRYIVTLNDQQVYRPKPLFKDFKLADTALDTCVRQTIADNKLTSPEQLATLHCSHAGIKSLEGIQLFTALTNLNLSNNQLISIAPLLSLTGLDTIDLSANPNLECHDIDRLATQTGARITLPEHCRD